jgi:hypothetical protein
MLTLSIAEGKAVKAHFAPRELSYLIKPLTQEQLLRCLRTHEHLRPLAEEILAK